MARGESGAGSYLWKKQQGEQKGAKRALLLKNNATERLLKSGQKKVKEV